MILVFSSDFRSLFANSFLSPLPPSFLSLPLQQQQQQQQQNRYQRGCFSPVRSSPLSETQPTASHSAPSLLNIFSSLVGSPKSSSVEVVGNRTLPLKRLLL